MNFRLVLEQAMTQVRSDETAGAGNQDSLSHMLLGFTPVTAAESSAARHKFNGNYCTVSVNGCADTVEPDATRQTSVTSARYLVETALGGC